LQNLYPVKKDIKLTNGNNRKKSCGSFLSGITNLGLFVYFSNDLLVVSFIYFDISGLINECLLKVNIFYRFKNKIYYTRITFVKFGFYLLVPGTEGIEEDLHP
jgi:hypothetical protein